MRAQLCLVLLLASGCRTVSSPAASVSPLPAAPEVALGLSNSEQIAIREDWLQRHHALLLPMMRKHAVSMWIVVNEEFHDDPLTPVVAPPRPYAGNRDLFVFVDAGEQGLKKYALTGYAEESLGRFFETGGDGVKPEQALAELFRRYQPRTIALAFEGRRGVTRSLTHASYAFLREALGPDAEKRFVPAGELIEEYLDTRIPEERPQYARMVALTEQLARRALSNEVITPGKTTVGEVRRFLFDELGRHGVSTWFQPDLRVQRAGADNATSRGFLAVAPENAVISRGDLIHVDFGISFLGLNTDFQRMAYVLREGEQDAPAGLKAALENTRALQDALMQRAARPGRTGAEVYELTMAEMKQRGIEAQIYSHPLGNQGHGLGPSIDFRAAARNEPPKALRPGSYVAVELNTATAVPEWNGKKVFVMEEDPAYLDQDGYHFFAQRQDAYFLVH